MFTNKVRIGANNRTGHGKGFDGKISCIQMFPKALDQAAIHFKKYCPDAENYSQISLTKPAKRNNPNRKPCNERSHYYDGICYDISVLEFPETFSNAEVECLPVLYSSYRRQLVWTENPRVWHHIASQVKNKTGKERFFIGLSDMDNNGIYTTRQE